MDFSLRFGEAEDAPLITDYILTAGAGLFEFLLDGLLPGIRARQFIKIAVSEENSALSYSNAVLAMRGEDCVGLALGYDSNELGIPPILKSIIPKARYSVLEPIFSRQLQPSWYINTLVVEEAARGCGVGRELVRCMSNLAGELGFESLTLHVWADNEAALKLYTREGFQEVERLAIPAQKNLNHTKGMILMSAALPL